MSAILIPDGSKKWIVLSVALVVVGLAIIGVLIVAPASKSPVSTAQRIAETSENSRFDPDFFRRPEPDPLPVQSAPEPVHDDLPPPPAPPAPPVPPIDALPPPPPPLPIEVGPRPDDPAVIAARRNAARRGAVAVRVAANGAWGDPGSVYDEAKGVWDEPKTEPSLPVDLSRTFTVDRWIPALVINEISSELPGKVVAQIEQNVYAAHGRKILIPAGSKAVGHYDAKLKNGQTRIMLIWSRIITPNGVNIHTGDADMSDAMGRAGMTGEVDNKYWEKYGMSLLISSISTAAVMSVPMEGRTQGYAVDRMGQGLVQTTRQIMQDHVDLRPVVHIPAGSRILISPRKDIWFKKISDSRIDILPIEQQ